MTEPQRTQSIEQASGQEEPAEPADAVVRSLRRRLGGGLAWALLGRMLFMVTGIVVSALATRVLNPAEAGIYFLALSIAASSAVIAQMGLHRASVRLVAESMATGLQGRARASIKHVWRFGVASALVVGSLLILPPGQWLLTRLFGAAFDQDLIVLLAALVVCKALGLLRGEIFRGFHEIRFASFFTGLDANLVTVLLLGSLYLYWPEMVDVRVVLGATALAWVPGLLLGAAMLRRRTARLVGPGDIRGRKVLRIALPMLLSGLGSLLLSHADLWVVGSRLTAEEVALYGAALRILVLVAVPLLVINAVVPPLIAEFHATGRKRQLEQMLRTTATVGGLPAALTVGVLILGGDRVLGIVLGGFYADAGPVLAILSVGPLVSVSVGSCAFLLTMSGHERVAMTITAACAAAMIVAALLVVGQFGLRGVAVVAATSVATQNIALWLAAHRLTGIWTHVGLRPTIFAAKSLWMSWRKGRSGPPWV